MWCIMKLLWLLLVTVLIAGVFKELSLGGLSNDFDNVHIIQVFYFILKSYVVIFKNWMYCYYSIAICSIDLNKIGISMWWD